MAIARPDFRRDLVQIQRKLETSSKFLKGRQMLHLMQKEFQTPTQIRQIKTMTDLLDVHLIRNDLQGFLYKWDEIVKKMEMPEAEGDVAGI